MKEQHPIDSLFQRKLAERSFPIPDGQWEAAAALIAADQKRKRKGLYLYAWLMLVIGSLGIAIGALFLSFPLVQEEAEPPSLSTLAIIEPKPTQPGHQIADEDSVLMRQSIPLTKTIQPQDAAVQTGSGNFYPPLKEEIHVADGRDGRSETIASPTVGDKMNTDILLSAEKTDTEAEAALISAGYAQKNSRIDEARMNASLTFVDQQAEQLVVDLDDRPFALHPTKLRAHYLKHRIGLTIGSSISIGWDGNVDPPSSVNGHPLLGIRYGYAINQRLRLQTGLLYHGRGALNQRLLFQSIELGFGADTTNVWVRPIRLHYLEVPLRFDWHVRGRHILMTGLHVSRLFNADAQITTERRNTFGHVSTSEDRQPGYQDLFNQWDVQLSLGYGYVLKPGLRMGARAQYGLLDQTRNQLFQNNALDRSLQVRLFVEYDLFQF
ncbi:MAG: hypothetical protein AAF206_27555 [Bacteroidota bacterium]